jgi:acetyl esterase/lipase
MALHLVPIFLGLLLTLNAWRPLHAPWPAALASGLLGWLTTELALHHLALQAILAAWAIHAGALASPVGALAVVSAAMSCMGLALLHRRGDRAGASMERALRAVIGDGYEERLAARAQPWTRPASSWWRILFPFALGHANVETHRGIRFAHVGGVTLKLDVHRHRAHPVRCPTLVHVHGGAWVLGLRIFQGLPLMRHLAARGWVCFSVDYRLSPRATFPEHLVDVKRALAWVKEHAEEYGGDPDFVVLCGNSAGAHLSALAALTPDDARYQPGFEATDTSVRACIGLYGVYDFTDRHGHWPYAGLDLLLRRVIMKTSRARSPEAYADASPIARVHEGAPPFLVVHGDCDSVAPPAESRRFAEALRSKGVPVVHAEVPDAQHAFEVFSSPRSAHFVTGAASFLAHVHRGYLEDRAEREAARASRGAPAFVRRAEPAPAGDPIATAPT